MAWMSVPNGTIGSVSDFGTTLLIVGSEALLVARRVEERVRAAKDSQPAAEIVDLSSADVAEGRFVEAVGGSLFASASIVVVRDISALPQEQFDLVVRTATAPGDDICLTLTHPGGVKGKGLLDRLGKAGVPRVSVEAYKINDLPRFVMDEAKRARIRLDVSVAHALVEAVGTDLAALSAAVTQLADDCPGSALTVETVNAYFAGRAEVSGFAIADAVMSGRPEHALRLLRWAFNTGTPIVLITAALASALRALGKYSGLREQRLAQPDMARAIGVPPWKLRDIESQSRGWTTAGLQRGIMAVALADAQVKGAATDPEYALERLVIALDQLRAKS